jgi:periplasmic protein TonB
LARPEPTPIRPTGDRRSATSPQAPAPASATVYVIVITTHDDLLLELGEALDGEASLNPVESAAGALERLGSFKRTQVVMIDSRTVADARAVADAVQAQAPHVAVLVFALADAEQQLAAALKNSNVFAVLPIPVDPHKTAAVFDGAVADSETKQAKPRSVAPERRSSISLEPSEMPAQPHEPAKPQRSGIGGRRINAPLVGGGAVIALLAVGAVWYFTRDTTPELAATPAPAATTVLTPPAPPLAQDTAPIEEPPPTSETSLITGNVDELLENARLAMRERRYTEPAGNNALLYFRSATAVDAGNGEALDGLARIGTVLAARFDDAMNGNRYDEAATALAQFKVAVDGDARIALFQQRLTSTLVSKALAENNLERATALVNSAQKSNAVPAAQLTKWRSAITRLQDQAREKLVTEQAARDAAVAAAQKKARETQAAAEAERQAQAAREKAQADKLKAEQAAASTIVAAPASETSKSQSGLKQKRYFAPDYPAAAFEKRISGSVTVAFIVDVKGEPRDIIVETANPPGVFDRAVIAAVKRWRYEPLLIDGVPTEAPIRMTIRFAPEK